VVLALKKQLNSVTSELESLLLHSSTRSTEGSIPDGGEIAGPSEEPANKRQKTSNKSSETEVDPTALPFLDELPEVDDIIHQLGVNGAALRVPEFIMLEMKYLICFWWWRMRALVK
jgi:hypothetical protein